MENIFSFLFPDGTTLSQQRIAELGWKSNVFPELPGSDEIKEIMEIVKTDHCQIWSYEYNKSAPIFANGDRKKIIDIFERHFYKNIFLGIVESMYFWIPEEHKFFVIIGKNDSEIDNIKSKIFHYGFDEYINEESHSDNLRHYLENIARTYTI